MDILPHKAPNLPYSPPEYDQRQQHQVHDVLRLYFSRVDNATAETIVGLNNMEVLYWLS